MKSPKQAIAIFTLLTSLATMGTACVMQSGNKNVDRELLQGLLDFAYCAPLQPTAQTLLVHQLLKKEDQTDYDLLVSDIKSLNLEASHEQSRKILLNNFQNYQQYQNVIIGDSTMQYNSALNLAQPGLFFDPSKTQSLAISGNKICDIIGQLPMIHTKNPTNIIVGTLGGNDLLNRAPIPYTLERGNFLINTLRAKYPRSRFVFIGVHPTKNAHANANKGTTNAAFKAMVEQDPRNCWYDPQELFGVSEGQEAPNSTMIDSVHYNPVTIGLGIKAKIATQCGVVF